MTESKSDILVKVPDNQLPKLRSFYQENAPWAPHMAGLIHTQIKWKNSAKYKNASTIYSPNNSWEKDGTIIVIIKNCGQDIVVFTLEHSCSTLYKALKETKVVDFTIERTLLFGVHEKHLSTVAKCLKEKKIKSEIVENYYYVLSPQEAENFLIECPHDVYIKQLDPSAGKMITDVWPHKFTNSDQYASNYIEANGGYGLFLKSTNEMVAWAIKSAFGHIALLQTDENHKRKGYASLMTKVLAKEIAEEGLSPLGSVVRTNKASISMFEKLGFRILSPCTYFLINYN